MTSKKVIVASTVVIVVSIVCILLMPVSKVLNEIELSNKRVSFSAVSGYWWRGNVHDVAIDYRGYRINVGRLHWQFDWRTLLSTHWCIHGSNSGSQELISAKFRVCYQLLESRFQIIDSVVELDAKTLANVSGLEIEGQWLINIVYATIEDKRLVDVYGEAIWQRAQWHNGEKWFALGDVLSTLETDQSFAININTTDIQGPLQIELNTVFSIPSAAASTITPISTQKEWSMTGFIEPYGNVPVSLADSLTLFSSSVAGKRYYFNY